MKPSQKGKRPEKKTKKRLETESHRQNYTLTDASVFAEKQKPRQTRRQTDNSSKINNLIQFCCV